MSTVTVIIPVYNMEKYLNECVESIVNQTYKSLEIILVDDGSVDRTPLICDEWAKKDVRIKVIHKTNGGQSEARNAALDIMTGEFVVFVDSDDWLEINTIQNMLDFMKDLGVDIVQGGVVKNWSDKEKIYRKTDTVKIFDRISAIEDIKNYIILDKKYSLLMNGVCTKLYKACLFDESRFAVGRIWEDTQVQPYLFNRADNGIAVIPGIHYHWRQEREDSTSHSINIKSRIDAYLAHKDHYNSFYTNPDFKDFKDKFVLCCLKSVVICYQDLYKFPDSERNKYKDTINEMAAFLRQYKKLAKKNFDKKTVFLIAKFKPNVSIKLVSDFIKFDEKKSEFYKKIYSILRRLGRPVKRLLKN